MMENSNNNNERYQAELEEYKAKKLIYYEHLLNTWATSRMEYDKGLLFVSTGAIGLLVTLLTTVKLVSFSYVIGLMLSCLAFLMAGISVIRTFWVNSDYISAVFSESEMRGKYLNRLQAWRKMALVAFGIGMVAALYVGLVSALHRF